MIKIKYDDDLRNKLTENIIPDYLNYYMFDELPGGVVWKIWKFRSMYVCHKRYAACINYELESLQDKERMVERLCTRGDLFLFCDNGILELYPKGSKKLYPLSRSESMNE